MILKYCIVLNLAILTSAKSCGSPADGVLNLLTFTVTSAQIVINVVNAVNNNNNNNNDNNNNNNNNENNENDNTFTITVENTVARSLQNLNIFSILNALIDGEKHPWKKLEIFQTESEIFKLILKTSRQCIMKSVCLMARNRQIGRNTLQDSMYKVAR